MQLVVHPRARPPVKLAVIAPFVGSAVILVAKLGIVAGVITLVVIWSGVVVVLRLVSRWSTRHCAGSARTPGVLLRAEASLDNKAGIVTVKPRLLQWTPRRAKARTAPVEVAASDITSIDLVPIDYFFMKAARCSIHRSDGTTNRLTITAPASTVEAAFRSAAN